MANIARDLLNRGVPLHCIGRRHARRRHTIISSFLSFCGGPGFESHFIAGSVPQDLAASMRQFTDLGLEVPLTELDVRVLVDGNDQATSADLATQ